MVPPCGASWTLFHDQWRLFHAKQMLGWQMSQNRRDLKFLCAGLAVCSMRVLWLVRSSLLCWLWARSTYSTVFDLAVQRPLRRACVISVADCFCLQKRKRDGTKWSRGAYLLLANKHCPQWWSTQLPQWPDSWLSSLSATKFVHNASCS